jgi:hypothetical protein
MIQVSEGARFALKTALNPHELNGKAIRLLIDDYT